VAAITALNVSYREEHGAPKEDPQGNPLHESGRDGHLVACNMQREDNNNRHSNEHASLWNVLHSKACMHYEPAH
jgi:hypothetical protein